MVTCGMYNASGKFAAFIGLPAKVVYQVRFLRLFRTCRPTLAISYWLWYRNLRTAIDPIGNSVAGVQLLKQLATEWDMTIFNK